MKFLTFSLICCSFFSNLFFFQKLSLAKSHDQILVPFTIGSKSLENIPYKHFEYLEGYNHNTTLKELKKGSWKKNLKKMDRFKDSDYYDVLKKADRMIENAERNALPVEKISTLILKCISIKRPKTRYIVHKNKFFFRLMAYYFPDKLSDWLVHKTLSSTNRHRPI